MNDTLALLVIGVAGIVSFVCFVLVLVQMFQRGKTGLAVGFIVLTLCCGIGGLITFIYGWVKAREWNMTNVMTVWTVAFVVNIVAGSLNPAPFRYLQEHMPQEARPVR